MASNDVVLYEGLLSVDRKGVPQVRYAVLYETHLDFYASEEARREEGAEPRGRISWSAVTGFEDAEDRFIIHTEDKSTSLASVRGGEAHSAADTAGAEAAWRAPLKTLLANATKLDGSPKKPESRTASQESKGGKTASEENAHGDEPPGDVDEHDEEEEMRPSEFRRAEAAEMMQQVLDGKSKANAPKGRFSHTQSFKMRTSLWLSGMKHGEVRDAQVDPETWQARTQGRVEAAKALKKQLEKARRSEPVPKAVQLKERNGGMAAQDKWRRTVLNEKNIADTTKACREALTHALHGVKMRVRRLNKSFIWGALAVNAKRLELRGKRPALETVQDELQVALERERGVLERCRDEVTEQLQAAREIADGADKKLAELNRRALSLIQDRSNAPQQLFDSIRTLVNQAMDACAKADVNVETLEKDAAVAREAGGALLKRYSADNQRLRKRLADELTEGRTVQTEASHRLKMLSCQLLALGFTPSIEEALKEESSSSSPTDAPPKERIPDKFANLRQKILSSAYFGPEGCDVGKMFAKMDGDGSGELDEDEFHRFMRKTLKIAPTTISDVETRVLFNMLDKDGGGTLSTAELHRFLLAERGPLSDRWRRLQQALKRLETSNNRLLADCRLKSASATIYDCMLKVFLTAAGAYAEMSDTTGHRVTHVSELEAAMVSESVAMDKDGSPDHSTPSTVTPRDGEKSAPSSPRKSPKPGRGDDGVRREMRAFEAPESEDLLVERSIKFLNDGVEARAYVLDVVREYEAHRVLRACGAAPKQPCAERVELPMHGSVVAAEKLKRLGTQEKEIAAGLRHHMGAMEQMALAVKKLLVRMQKSKISENLKVTEARLEIRGRRPEPELIQDDLQKALESEQALLSTSRQRLAEVKAEGDALQRSIASARVEMTRSKLTLHLDRTEKPKALLDKMAQILNDGKDFVEKGKQTIVAAETSMVKSRELTTVKFKAHVAALEVVIRDLEKEWEELVAEMKRAKKHLAKLEIDLQEYGDLNANGGPMPAQTEQLEKVRDKIRAAAYVTTGGHQLEAMFRKLDKDGSGELDADELRLAFRRTLKIPDSVVSNAEFFQLCASLDADQSGTVSLQELMAFINFIDVKEAGAKIMSQRELIQRLEALAKELHEDRRWKIAARKMDGKALLLSTAAQIPMSASRTGSLATSPVSSPRGGAAAASSPGSPSSASSSVGSGGEGLETERQRELPLTVDA
eukprot:TRINITY_DN36260_c0_g1_i1.p1 TRINITY_DN36260_c0_g1~~TRINITY_DN36260_c0_g1_i1.p1  ORF type:complete len:1212 (+),score=404.48 TRINITY_DN36260_c0_g1_i1:146-3781(+)